jgi:hypothetical protein
MTYRRAAIILAVLAVPGMFLLGLVVGFPQVPSAIQERRFIAMLATHPTYAEVRARLIADRTEWHAGESFTEDMSLLQFQNHGYESTPCTTDCETVLQAVFGRDFALCVVHGDAVTMRFDKQHRLASWEVTPRGDGC